MKQRTCEADLAGLALHAVPDEEMKATRQHVAICRTCDRLLAEYEEAAALLGANVLQVPLPRTLKTRVLRAAAAHGRIGASSGRYSHESG